MEKNLISVRGARGTEGGDIQLGLARIDGGSSITQLSLRTRSSGGRWVEQRRDLRSSEVSRRRADDATHSTWDHWCKACCPSDWAPGV